MSRLDKLLKMLDAEPDDPFVLYGIAQEYAKRNTPEDNAKAVQFFDRCLGADPKYTYAYYHKAQTLKADERTAEALAAIEYGLEIAKSAGDSKALNELIALKDSMT